MLGNFSYCNPTKLYFGEDSLDCLREELPKYGENVMLVYGGGSIKRNGIYDQVVKLLDESGKNVFEDPGVMPNPTVEKLYEGCRIARENQVDLILAVGGGSVCDYAKAVSGLYLHPAQVSDDRGILRYHVPHPGAVFFRGGRQYLRLYHGGAAEIPDPQHPDRSTTSHGLRGQKQYHVDRHLGAQHAGGQG